MNLVTIYGHQYRYMCPKRLDGTHPKFTGMERIERTDGVIEIEFQTDNPENSGSILCRPSEAKWLAHELLAAAFKHENNEETQ